jgi:voltage-gated potassium channel
MTLRQRAWQILGAAQPGDRPSYVFDVFLLALISVNIIAVILETVRGVQLRYGSLLLGVEYFSIAVFSVEYLVRLWAAPHDPRYQGAVRGRLRWAMSPMALVDLLAVLPFYLPFLGFDLRMARALRLARIFRIAKLGRYVHTLRLFADVVRAKREELVMTTFILAFLLLVASSLMYYAENPVQPEAFSSIPASMWWAAATLTTVGYGDVYPITPLGRLLGAGVAIVGIGLFALPTAILGSGFIEEVARRKERPHCPHCGEELP